MAVKHGSTAKRTLLAFDFDHTICEENTDIFVLRLLEGKELPEEISVLRKTAGWTKYMQAIFEFLHDQGIGGDAIRAHMQRAPLVSGMVEFFQHIRLNRDTYDCIIISDSNSLFIWYILHYCRLEDIFPSNSVYTNPARLDEDDCLRIEYHHQNSTCRMSADNLCKGRVLEEHMDRFHTQHSQHYQSIVFFGDGMNDYCPSTRLGTADYVAARKGYKLLDKINQDPAKVKAGIVPWTDGKDLLNFIHNFEKSL
ncbi:putative Pyridoxal phosphate phosphatase PHOSPHO2 [Hypsibius exemplaris]|uniref:Pyridoxal phosphate phosphatase PHOSPHO2 n=1 Tax=Hypsibius exemplaris TaxID=2072580 RepID=A0A1W0X9N7_HYPEX|nr:putative Pyridoxal phosphate phosphatase PHOSPHO2 [Hypsibius exemplaris]